MSKKYKENFPITINEVREILREFEPCHIDQAEIIAFVIAYAQDHPDEYITECVRKCLIDRYTDINKKSLI